MERLTKYLETYQDARERKNRYRVIANFLMTDYHLRTGNEAKDNTKRVLLEEMLHDAESMNRTIRKIQQENEALRGSDYSSKNKVENDWLENNGYSKEPEFINHDYDDVIHS